MPRFNCSTLSNRVVSISITLLLVIAAVLVPRSLASRSTTVQQASNRHSNLTERARRAYGQLSPSFEENRGQFGKGVMFGARAGNYMVLLTSSGAVLVPKPKRFTAAQSEETKFNRLHELDSSDLNRPIKAVQMKLVGGAPNPVITGTSQLQGKVNYFRSNQPEQWKTDIPTFAGVKYRNVYPGIDMVYYSKGREIEYDFVIAPGVSPDVIDISYEGAKKLSIDSASGDLLLETEEGILRQHSPTVYQDVGQERRAVRGAYKLRGPNSIGFDLGTYDQTKPLIIDPVLSYSTLLGGDGDYSYAVAVDASGNAYITGETFGLTFLNIEDGLQPNFAGSVDAVVIKLNSAGTDVVYATYLGGPQSDVGYDIAVDSSGSAIVAGFGGFNFPVTAGAFQVSFGDVFDAFVAKLTPSGNGLVYSTLLGGNGTDIAGALVLDSSGNAFVGGYTFSTNFPTTFGVAQSGNRGGQDGFVSKLNPTGTALLYSTLIGSGGLDNVFGLKVDGAGNAYVAGDTQGLNFPIVNPIQSTSHGANRGVFKSSDGGASFTLKNRGLTDSFIETLVVDPSDSSLFYAGTRGGVYKSRNSGEDWEPTGLSNLTRSIAIDPTNTSVVYAGTSVGIFKSTNAGNSWTRLTGMFLNTIGGVFFPNVFAIKIDPSNPSNVFIGTTSGPFRSTNAGTTWTRLITGLNTNASRNIRALVIDPVNPSTAYVGTLGQGVFKTTNNGASWAAVNTGIPSGNPQAINALVVDPSSPATLYVGTNLGVFKTTNGGTSWSAVSNGLNYQMTDNSTVTAAIQSLLINPTSPNTIYAGPRSFTSATGFALTAAFKSTDGGNTWTILQNGFPANTINAVGAMAFQSGTGNLIFGTYGDSEGFVAKVSPDGSSFLFSSYFGGELGDSARDLSLDAAGNIYISGSTLGRGFVTTPGALQTTFGGLRDLFVAKINGSNHSLAYSTFLGGSLFEDSYGMEVDSAGNAYVFGSSNSVNFPTTAGAFQRVKGDGGFSPTRDAVITKVNPQGSGLVYSSYLGGSEDEFHILEVGHPIAVDSNGNAYVTGTTQLTGFPTTDGAFQTGSFGPGMVEGSFVTKIEGTANSFSITGRLLTSNGTPISANIDVTGTKQYFSFSDVNGYYSIPNVTPGTYTVTPFESDVSFAPLNQTLTNVSTDQVVNFTGSPTYQISGRISQGATGLRNIQVILTGTTNLSTVTDQFGNYFFLNLPEGGNFTVIPTTPGFSFSPPSRTYPNLNSDQFSQDFTTASASIYSITGNIIDGSANPVPNARVICSNNDFALATTSDVNGNYACTNLHGDITVSASKVGQIFTPFRQTFVNPTTNQVQNFTGSTVTGLTNKIAFSGAIGAYDIYMMNADGTNRSNVTGTTEYEEGPAWSPDGTRLLFSSYHPETDSTEIFKINSNGTGLTRLTSDKVEDFDPAWSPDGTKIALARDTDPDNNDSTDNADIFVMNQDGTNLVNLTPTYLGMDYSPAWSPNGSKIAFARAESIQDSSDNADIFVMNSDGSALTRLTNNSVFVDGLSWSPDGTKIAYSKEVSSSQQHIFVMNADGTGETQLTTNPVGDSSASFNDHPSWSPDGTKIVFARSVAGFATSKLFVMNANGTGMAALTDPAQATFEFDPAWQPGSPPGEGRTFTVTNTNDSGAGSLRQAIIDANNNAGRDTIAFSILPATGVKTINLLSELPIITSPVVIDGFTQGSSITPVIELNGTGAFAVNDGDGLEITAGNSVVRGLAINRFSRYGIVLQGGGGNRIEGNFIGTNSSGSAVSANANSGIAIFNSSNNIIGGQDIFGRNLISGNGTAGVEISSGSTGNRVINCLIGTNQSGNAVIANTGSGILIAGGSSGNTIGGLSFFDRNVISGNGTQGVVITGSGTTNNQVVGNLIGTDLQGLADLGNTREGVFVANGATNNRIGGLVAAARNVISGNNIDGLNLQGSGTTGNLVQGNFIGVSGNGNSALGNTGNGVVIAAPNNTIGGTSAGARNVIAANTANGILVVSFAGSNASGNLIQGNYIGTSIAGSPLGNLQSGIAIAGVSNNSIGGTVAGATNLIAYNTGNGVTVTSGTGASLLSNSIFSNGGLPIALVSNGNNNQPAPRMTVASASANGVVAQGTATGPSNTALTIQLFASTACDQAERLLGTAVTTTDGSGNASFSANLSAPVDGRKYITATTTDPAGNTSTVTTCADVVTNTAFISGQVTDVLGLPLTNVVITLSGAPSRVAHTDGNGRYFFSGLAPNITYTVTPQSPYYGFIPVRETFPNLAGPTVANFVSQPTISPTIFPPPSDNFDGPNRDPERWNLGTLSHPLSDFDPLVTVVQQNGKLVITPRANVTGDHFNGYVSVNSFDLTNGIASVKLEQVGSGSTEAVFGIGEDTENFYRFVVAGPNLSQAARDRLRLGPATSSNTLLYFQVVINGQVQRTSIAYDSVQHAHLRFRHDPVQLALHFETSPDNLTWTTRHTISLQGKTVNAVITELSAGTGGPDANPGQVVFENYQLITNTMRFAVATTRVGEGDGKVAILVRRIGSTASAAFVNYSTSSESASERTDFITTLGTLQFGPGELEKSFEVLLSEDSFMEGDEAFNVLLSNPFGSGLDAPGRERVVITDNETVNGPNMIDDPRNYARQHYLDFLNRQPDQSGLDFWANQVTGCGNPDLLVCRINVSAAFFLSIEFQETGYLVYRTYKAAYGNISGKPVPVRLNEFLTDTQKIGQGVIVNVGDWQQKLEQNKQAFMTEFVTRSRFTDTLPGTLTAAQFVDQLNQNADGALSQAERDSLVTALTNGSMTRAQVLRSVAEDQTLRDTEFRRAFVLFQYFGYLRRNPDDLPDSNYDGYNFWLSKLNQFNGNFVDAEMVKAFILAGEYRHRFGP